MGFSRQQIQSIIGFFILFLLLFFGCDKQSKKQKDLETSRSKKVEILSIQKVISEARDKLLPEQRMNIDFLNNNLDQAVDSTELKVLEKLASEWYQLGHELISGYYAEAIANKLNDEASWSITGTTYALAQTSSQDLTEKQYASQKAIDAFEKAFSINPENPNHKINLALTYVENPPEDNPMKGILMLLELNKKFPNNVKVLTQLGLLAIRTNQTEKAIERFEQTLAIDADNKIANCKLAEVYASINQSEKSALYLAKCK